MRKSKGRGEKNGGKRQGADGDRERVRAWCGRRESAQKDGAGVVVKKKRVLAWLGQGESV